MTWWKRKNRQAAADATTTLADITHEEALLVARVTAFRLARHMGRATPQSQHLYDSDPRTYIASLAKELLKDLASRPTLFGGTRKFDGRPKKIGTRQDALDLCLNVAASLALAGEGSDAGSTPDPKKIDRLARQELELTLSLIRSADGIAPYPEYDPSEARAAHDLQIPFAVALRLGENGLLKDPPGPTESRRRIIGDAIRELRDA